MSDDNINRPPPLQPTALSRSDNDGMYVAVGANAFNRNSNNSNQNNIGDHQHIVETPQHNNTNNNTGGGGGGRDSYYYSQPVRDSDVRQYREPYTKNKIDYSVSANESKFRHHKIMMRGSEHDNQNNNAEDDLREMTEHNNNHHRGRSPSSARSDSSSTSPSSRMQHVRFPYATGRVRYGTKQHWIAGYTTGCFSHVPTCLDAFFCIWCVNGMQWQRIHAKPGEGGRFEVFYGVENEDTTTDGVMNRKYGREGDANNNNDDRGNNDEDDPRFRAAEAESIFDKCDRIDWVCCGLSFLVDVLTCPFTLTPFGSAASQYHIRKTLRVRYNLVDAPGSASEEEREDMRLAKIKKDQDRREKLRKDKEKESYEKKFGHQKPTPRTMVDVEDDDRQSTQTDPNYSYKFSKKELANNNKETEEAEKNNNKKKNSASHETSGSSDGGFCSTLCEPCIGDKKNGDRGVCSSDELKEFCVSVCCAPCSTAQVQRELTMRGEWPGGYWSKPMKVRADLAPGRGVQDTLRMMASLSPSRQRTRGGLNSARDSEMSARIADGHHNNNNIVLNQPPPTPNDNRYQGSGPSTHLSTNFQFVSNNSNNSNNNPRSSSNSPSRRGHNFHNDTPGNDDDQNRYANHNLATPPSPQPHRQHQQEGDLQQDPNNRSYSPDDQPLKPTRLGIRNR